MKISKNISVQLAGAFIVGSILIGGCSSTQEKKSVDSPSPLSGTDEQIFVGDTIEMNYDPNVIMKRAESFHKKNGYPEAIIEYQHFLDLHSNHVLAPYAQYRLALSHFKMIKTIDRDVSPVERAHDSFIRLLQTYPGSQYEAEARNKISECEDLLAQHYLFVAEFYYRKEAYLAAAKRYRMVIESYPHLEVAAEAKYKLAKTYNDLGVPEWSRDWLVTLVQDHPSHNLRDDGLKMLEKLKKEHPNLIVAQNLGNLNRNLPATKFLPLNQTRQAVPLGTLVNVSSVPKMQPKSPVLSKPSASECKIGSWCEALNTEKPASKSTQVSQTPITCQPGMWCE